MRSFGTTIVMGVIALVMCGAAFYYYPKLAPPETGLQGFLFEDYETASVRYIKIDKFDPDTRTMQKLQLALVGGGWVIPDKNNFLASNVARVSRATAALKDRTILRLVSDQQEDFESYGVLEFDDQTGSLGVGTLITLEDRSKNRIGQLIVGEANENDDSKRFVRIPGQPQVYEIEFDASILETEFVKWVDGNLLRMRTDEVDPGNRIHHLVIDKYFIDAQNLNDKAARKYVYRTRLVPTETQLLVTVWMADEQGQLLTEPTHKDEATNTDTFGALFGQLFQFQVLDVRRKTFEVEEHLATPKKTDSPADFNTTVAAGFRQTGMEFEQHQFDAVAGEVTIAFLNGSQYKLYLGNLAGVDFSDGSKLSRFLMVTAQIDESQVPLPGSPQGTPPAAGGGDSDTQQADSSQNAPDQQQRDQLRLTQERDALLQAARQQVDRINQVNAAWYYVVSESIAENLFPPATSWLATDHEHQP